MTSEPGNGTSFAVYLPPSDAVDIPVIVSNIRYESSGMLENQGRKILVVDDNTTIAFLNKEILEGMGFAVTIRTDSREALKLISETPEKFEMLITDQTMPFMTGLELADKVREIAPSIPIIPCTGFSTEVNEETAYQHNISCFLYKPISPALLQKHVSELLQESG